MSGVKISTKDNKVNLTDGYVSYEYNVKNWFVDKKPQKTDMENSNPLEYYDGYIFDSNFTKKFSLSNKSPDYMNILRMTNGELDLYLHLITSDANITEPLKPVKTPF